MSKLRLEPVKAPHSMSSYWKREWKVVSAVAIFGLLFDGLMAFGPILQGRLIDTLIEGASLQRILRQAAIFAGMILFQQINRFFKRFFVRLFANRTSAAMRMNIYSSILHRSIHDMASEQSGDLMTKAVADVDICVEGMRKVTTEVFDTGVLMLSYLISLLIYDWKITLPVCVFIPAAMFLAEKLKTIIVRLSATARKQNSTVANLTFTNIENTLLYRIFGTQTINQARYQDQLADLEKKSIRAGIVETSMQPIYKAIAMLGIVLVLWQGGLNTIHDIWTVGVFSAYITIFCALTEKASKTAKLFNSYQKARVSWYRVKPYLAEAAWSDEPAKRFGTPEFSLALQDMSFSYTPDSDAVLRNVSFTAFSGQIVGITGPVACGKSSLGMALTGLYEYSGQISINGRELRDFSNSERCGLISWSGHKAQLFSDSIANNVCMGETGSALIVLEDVCFMQDLESMPAGIETILGSERRLSGGQQARLSMARALLHSAPLLILDDPFASVDAATEKQIYARLRANYADRLIILISHRLSLFPMLDQVVLLEKDKAPVTGTHISLMKTSAIYAELFELQSGETP